MPDHPPAIACWLCGRPLGRRVELHHPVPKSRGGRDTVPVHPICHRTLHRHFSNKQLETLALAELRANADIARFLAWIADKPPDFHAPTRKRRWPPTPSRLMVQRANRGSKPMNRSILLAAALALPVASCGSRPAVDEQNASVEEVAQKVREASDDEGLLRPGKWQTSVKIEEMDMPGMPREAAEQMKRMFAQTQATESCLTPEEARQPKGDFFGANENCRYDHFRMGGGKIDAAMRCTQGGATQTMEMAGTYSRDAYEMRMKSRMEGGPAGGPMTMQMKVEASRVGECTRGAA